MCGISGILNLDPTQTIDLDLLKTINRLQSHRGPDDEGYYCDHIVGLAHRRLSIIDINSGHQPIFNEDGTIAIVFNGEIYNFIDLVVELEKLGHQFKTHSDTEVIVHAWEEWGVDCLSRFRGMFAFAVWDSNKRQLFIARDRLGKKPFHYSITPNGQFVFASELKVLMAHPYVNKNLRMELAEDFFMFGYVPDPYTAYENIFKLEAGHYALINVGDTSISPTQYWDLNSSNSQSHNASQEQLIELLTEAVKFRLVSDVPLGAFLSGGVDSSAMVALMSQLQDEPVNTCSIGFSESSHDESEYAHNIAKRYSTNHHTHILDPEQAYDVSILQGIYDEPFADSSALPTYHVCKLARKHVKVAISGDGGDELFAGYRRQRMQFNEERLKSKLPFAIRAPLFGALGRIYPKADWAPQIFRAKTTFQSLSMNSVEGYANSVSKMRIEERAKLFSSKYIRSLGGYTANAHLNRHIGNAPTEDPLKAIQYLDMKTWLVGDILTKVDRASMANSLEVRAPLLDHKFMEWGFSVDSKHNIHGNQGKYLFKKSLENYVDSDILYRPKMGFSMPISQWFRGKLKEDLKTSMFSDAVLDSGFFEKSQLEKMYTDHQSGYSDHGASLWSILMFSHFLEAQ